jgi:ElaB/YqjD/DUF883 family membrane-anchored ribosome-binding protein
MTDRQAEQQGTEVAAEVEAEETSKPDGQVSDQSNPEQLRQDIEETRAELGDTVDALSRKADVKAQVSQKVEERKAAWRERQSDATAKVTAARERVSEAAPDDAKRAASKVAHTAQERPLPAIAAGLGVGLMIGWRLGRR